MAGEATIQLELCAPGRDLVELDIREATLPGEAGVFAVYPGHTPLLSTLLPGVLVVIDGNGDEHFFAVQGGFAEVRDGSLVVLADAFEPQEDINTERAQAAEERAQERLKKPPENMDWERAEAALARATARLRASGRHGYH